MTSETVVQTERLVLRPFTLEDRDPLLKVFADVDAQRFYPEMAKADMATKWIQRNLERYETDGVGLWALCLRETRELVGDCGLVYQTVEEHRELEVAYHVHADQRGRGLATEAARACLDHGFGTLDCTQIVSMVHPNNQASKAVAQRVHRNVRRFLRLGDRYYLFCTTRDEWSSGVERSR